MTSSSSSGLPESVDDDDADEEEENEILRQAKKRKLLSNLRDDIYCKLQPSSIDGVGVVPFRRIPMGVNPFKTNGPPSGKTIDLNDSDIQQLPTEVQDMIKRHFVGGVYSVPEAGLNTLNISYFVNSSHGCVNLPNMQLGVRRDDQGLTEMVASCNIEPADELLWPYEFTGRGTGCLDDEDGRPLNRLPEEVVVANECRICMERVSGGVKTGCNCTSRMHLDCAKKWYTSRIQLVFSQVKLPEDAVSVVHDRWIATTTATCEVCTHNVSLRFAQTVMASIENNPGIQKLHGHIVNKEAVSIKFAKVPGHTIVRRQITCSKSGCRPHQYYDHVIRDRVSMRCAGKRTQKSFAPAQAREGNPSLRSSSASLFHNSPWDGYEPGMFANSKAKFWVDDGKKSKRKPLWVEGKMHEYYSAEDRNRNSCVCSNAVCSCMNRSKGMYRITYKHHGEEVVDYCSDYDDTVVSHRKIAKL